MGEFRRLLSFVLPYKNLLIISIIVVLISAFIELSLPFIVKTAIDKHISPQVAKLEKIPPWKDKYPDAFFENFVLIYKLPNHLRAELEKLGYISKERYFIISDSIENAIKFKDKYIISVEDYKSIKNSISLRKDDIFGIILLSGLYFLLLILNFVLNYFQIILLTLIGQKSIFVIRTKLFEHLLNLPISFFQKQKVGRLVTRVANDIDAINEFYTSVLVNLVKDFILIFGIIILMLIMNVKITLIVLSIIPFLIIATALFRYFARKAYDNVRRILGELNAFLNETIIGISIIQAFNSQRYMLNKFLNINNELFKAFLNLIYVFGIFMPVVSLASSIAIALLIYHGGGDIIRQAFTFGALVAFINYIEMLFNPIRDLAEKYNSMQSAFIASKRVFLLLSEKEEDKGKGIILDEIKGHIEFKNVYFAYEDEEWVIKNLNLTIEPGQKVAIVGPTGSGKTTIMNLLLRFYDIQKGEILLDGVNIKNLDLKFLRSQFSLVLQDVFLFSGSVEDNIFLYRKNGKVENYFDYLGVKNLIDINKFVNERGVSFSSGQRQIISFIRALANNPKILLLDEATSNIDQETELIIQKALLKLLENKTAIIIAHRLATVKFVDKIVVLYYGEKIEEGTHEELLAKKGFYYHLYTLQFENV
ncbi:MAG: ABC transporter ATP-binding protein [candidate division WOR-3 bacterium]